MSQTNFFELIAENTTDVISIFTPTFQRLYVSPSIKDLVGYTSAEILSMDVNVPIPDEDTLYVRPIVRGAIAKGESCKVEHRLIHKDGSIIWVEVLVRPIFSDKGELTWILTSARDISARKDRERELESERRLRQELYNISSLSHEIRTPLTILVSALELLRETAQQKEHIALINTLDSVSHTLSALVDNVLDYASLREGRSEIHPVNFDIHDFCQKLHSVHSTFAADKGLDLILKIDDDVPKHILTDSHKLKQILSNLLSNAIKFTKEGSVRLAVKKAGPAELLFTLTDTGIGIPHELQKDIFRPFVQQHTSEIRNDGSGLGLSIVSSLVTLLHGTLEVQSAVNEGSTFSIQIPLVPATGPVRTPSKGDISGMRILYIDDLLVSQDLHKRLFEKAGAYCHVSSDIDSLRGSQYQNFDVILLDIHLSDQNSLPHIRSLTREYPDANVIIYSADTSDDLVKSAADYGAADFIAKPVDFKMLLQAIGKYKRQRVMDLSIYQDIYRSNPREYFLAMGLLIRDFDFFVQEFERSTAKNDSARLKKAIHRIKPIAKQTKITRFFNLLSDVESFQKANDWTSIVSLMPDVTAWVDAILTELRGVRNESAEGRGHT